MKYNEGDIVTAKLTKVHASHLSNGAYAFFKNEDIISHAPAPFDMANAKTGMAWIGPYDSAGGSKIWYYVGHSPVAADMYVFANARGGFHSWYAGGIAVMCRIPERDKVME